MPQSLEEATSLMTEFGEDILVIAGGTLAMPLINAGVSRPIKVLSLKNTRLDYINASNGQMVIGATTTLSQIVNQNSIPILQEAAMAVGGWAIRNMGTVAGNIFAPPPGGDFAVAALALDAELILVRKSEKRSIPLSEFYTGFMMNKLMPGEIVSEIRFKKAAGKAAYLKYGRRHANTPSIVTVAANLDFSGEEVARARIALGAVGSHPFRSQKAEEFLVGKLLRSDTIDQAALLALEDSEPFTDPVASEWYRRKMVPVIVRRTLTKLVS
jgi:CO/xanthine dehydrogenase FAD-binding subunit